MGPDNRTHNTSIPPRPRFLWDIKIVPCTDRRGVQQELGDVVDRWKTFHNNFTESNSNKIMALNQGIVFQSHLYGRKGDLNNYLDDDVINGKVGVNAIGDSIRKFNPLTTLLWCTLIKMFKQS